MAGEEVASNVSGMTRIDYASDIDISVAPAQVPKASAPTGTKSGQKAIKEKKMPRKPGSSSKPKVIQLKKMPKTPLKREPAESKSGSVGKVKSKSSFRKSWRRLKSDRTPAR